MPGSFPLSQPPGMPHGDNAAGGFARSPPWVSVLDVLTAGCPFNRQANRQVSRPTTPCLHPRTSLYRDRRRRRRPPVHTHRRRRRPSEGTEGEDGEGRWWCQLSTFEGFDRAAQPPGESAARRECAARGDGVVVVVLCVLCRSCGRPSRFRGSRFWLVLGGHKMQRRAERTFDIAPNPPLLTPPEWPSVSLSASASPTTPPPTAGGS